MVQREIAARVGKSREAVSNTLRLLALPPEIQESLRAGEISEGHARAILMAGDDPAQQFQVHHDVVADRLTVREAENRARQVSGKRFVPHKRASTVQDPELREWQNRLQEHLGQKYNCSVLGSAARL